MKMPPAAPSLTAPSTAAVVECRVVGEDIRRAAAYLGEPTPNIDTASVDRNTRPRAFSLMETQRRGATCFYKKQQSNSNLPRLMSLLQTPIFENNQALNTTSDPSLCNYLMLFLVLFWFRSPLRPAVCCSATRSIKHPADI